ncbi:MAG: hypothetical protein V4489_05645 [Chlamydiota bacterium]
MAASLSSDNCIDVWALEGEGKEFESTQAKKKLTWEGKPDIKIKPQITNIQICGDEIRFMVGSERLLGGTEMRARCPLSGKGVIYIDENNYKQVIFSAIAKNELDKLDEFQDEFEYSIPKNKTVCNSFAKCLQNIETLGGVVDSR